MRTVRYENQVWNIDVEKNVLYLPNNKKITVDIDQVFDQLSDKDQNKIAEQFAEGNDLTDEEIDELVFESHRKFERHERDTFGYPDED